MTGYNDPLLTKDEAAHSFAEGQGGVSPAPTKGDTVPPAPIYTQRYIKLDKREISERYSQIAGMVLKAEESLKYITESRATIAYLSSDHEKKSDGKVVHGQCEKVPEKYKWAVPCDFTITVFEPNVEKFTDEQFYILLFHELLHVGIEVDGNEEKYFVKPHDIEDFKLIMDRFGMDWSEV